MKTKPILGDRRVSLASLIKEAGFSTSTGQARDLIKAGAVSVDGLNITDPMKNVLLSELSGKTLRVGKHRSKVFDGV